MREGKGEEKREGRGKEWGGQGENDLTHPVSQIPGYASGIGRSLCSYYKLLSSLAYSTCT